MQPITVNVGPLAAADANGIAEAQTISGAADLVLGGALAVGGVAYLDVPRQVGVSSVGNDEAVAFTIIGTTFGGAPISEIIQGTNGGVAVTQLDFLTVTQVATSGSTADDVTVGTTEVAGSRWARFDSWANAETAIQCTVSGTVNYTVQITMNDPNDSTAPVAIESVDWINSSDTNAVGATGNITTGFARTPTFARVLLNSGTGGVSSTFAQFNVVNK